MFALGRQANHNGNGVNMIYSIVNGIIIPEGVPLDVQSFHFALEACADRSLWREARGLLHLMTQRANDGEGPRPDTLAYNLTLRAHLNGLKFKDGSRDSLDDVLEAMGVAGDVIDDDMLGISWEVVRGLL